MQTTKDDIAKVISEYYHIKYSDILEKRKYPISAAKNLFIYMVSKEEKCLLNKDLALLLNISVRNVYYRKKTAIQDIKSKSRLYYDYMNIKKQLKKTIRHE